MLKKMKKYTKDPKFDVEVVEAQSMVAAQICEYILEVEEYCRLRDGGALVPPEELDQEQKQDQELEQQLVEEVFVKTNETSLTQKKEPSRSGSDDEDDI